MTIECTRYHPVHKGSLLGYADLFSPKMGLEITGCSLHSKDGKKWLNLPQKEFKDKDGATKYAAVIKFRNADHGKAFAKLALDAVEKKAAEGSPPPMQPGEDEGFLPF